jgi:hypothetical protein
MRYASNDAMIGMLSERSANTRWAALARRRREPSSTARPSVVRRPRSFWKEWSAHEAALPAAIVATGSRESRARGKGCSVQEANRNGKDNLA